MTGKLMVYASISLDLTKYVIPETAQRMSGISSFITCQLFLLTILKGCQPQQSFINALL